MTMLQLVFALALCTAAGHSFLSEKVLLRSLRSQGAKGTAMAGRSTQRLTILMFHLASICWTGLAAGLAAGLLFLDASAPSQRPLFLIAATVFAISGIGNFWSMGKPHFGGIMLLASSDLVLATLYT